MVQSPTRARSIQSSNFVTIFLVVLFSIAVIHSINKSLKSYNAYFKVAKDSPKSAAVTGDILADLKVNIDSSIDETVDTEISVMTGDEGDKSTFEDNEEEDEESDIDITQSEAIDEPEEKQVEEEAEEEEAQNDDDDEDDGEKIKKTTNDNQKMEIVAETESGEDTQNTTHAEEKDVSIRSEVDEHAEMKRDDSIEDKEEDTEEAETDKGDKNDGTDESTVIDKNTIVQGVKELDEDLHDVEDDQAKDKASDGILKVEVAQEDPVETSTEI